MPLFNLLEKFNGEKAFETIAKGGESREIRRYSLRRIPPYIVFVVKRRARLVLLLAMLSGCDAAQGRCGES